ncbi:hypothetical protein ACIQOU_14965 [Streptomyces sp. NPDC091279]|uniref:hypothetical protein n=1 Tax=unclassified Streptomyces TaxID=2593676 RepID=UPI003809FE91
MRLRNAVAAGLGALMLLLTVSTPANAATGTFEYKLRDTVNMKKLTIKITDPVEEKCYSVPGHDRDRGYYANNGTDASATIYSGFKCDGTTRKIPSRGTGSGSGEHWYFGSVMFWKA